MSYTPTVWQNGDTITAQKMNKLENGVASAGGGETFTVTFTEIRGSSGGDFTPDKTVAQAKAAYDAGQKVVGVISGIQDDYSGVTLDAYYISGHDVEPPYIDFKGWGPVYADGDSFNSFKFYRLRLFDYEGEPAVLVNMTNIT